LYSLICNRSKTKQQQQKVLIATNKQQKISSSDSESENDGSNVAIAPKRASTINRSKLPYSVEEAILRSLVPPHCLVEKFRYVCDSQPLLFGSYGSKLRQSIIQRRYLLKQKRQSNYRAFQQYCGVFGITTPRSFADCLSKEDEGNDNESVQTESSEVVNFRMSTPMKSPPSLLLKNAPDEIAGKYNQMRFNLCINSY
jgi:hypothetical protein